MEKGTLVEFKLQGDRRLAVIDRPDGKNRWIVIDKREQSHSIAPRQINYQIAGETCKPSEIPGFLSAIEPYLDASSLEVAWELLVEDGAAVTPEEMALLLFSESSPTQSYAAHCLLSDDRI